MRKWKLLVMVGPPAVVAVLLACALLLNLLRALSPGVTEANAGRVKIGMTLAEVESILGLHKDPYFEPSDPQNQIDDGNHFWPSQEFLVAIHFDADGKVDSKHLIPLPGDPPGWLKRQWRHWFP
jgi:hypothetical protein